MHAISAYVFKPQKLMKVVFVTTEFRNSCESLHPLNTVDFLKRAHFRGLALHSVISDWGSRSTFGLTSLHPLFYDLKVQRWQVLLMDELRWGALSQEYRSLIHSCNRLQGSSLKSLIRS